MPLRIVRNDLTKMKVDAIVNAADPSLLGGGGVDGMIHEAAGPQLLEACRKLGGCRPGEAKMTKGFLLPARYVIHTVGPVWQGGTQGEAGILADCYRNSLALAAVNRLRTVAFPLISAGTYGYPNAEALRVAVDTIAAWLMESEDMTVYLVVFSRSAYEVSSKLFSDVRVLIDDAYAARHEEEQVKRMRRAAGVLADSMVSPPPPMAYGYAPSTKKKSASVSSRRNDDLGDLIRGADEGFSELLLHKIDERGMTDSECYKKANIDRRVFSKIRSRRDYRPSKSTACAFALALELSGSEADDFLARAGYALSTAQPFDIILRYCIDHHVFNVHEVNAVLFQYDQPLLGA